MRSHVSAFGRIVSAAFAVMVFAGFVSSAAVGATPDDSFYNSNNILFYDPTYTGCAASGTGSTDASDVTSVTGSDNMQKIFNYLTGRGLSNEQAAGILGNMQVESGFSPTRQEISQTFPAGGWGLSQWTGGRRDEVVSAVKNAGLGKYYDNQYGGAVTADNGYVADGITPSDDNALILAEMNFLYKESSTSRTISIKTASKGYGSAGDNEMATIKAQKTVKAASDIWVYNYEIPADIDATAVVRAQNGEAILKKMTGAEDGSTATATTSTDSCSTSDSDSSDENVAASGPVRDRIVQVAQAEFNKWDSGKLTAGTDYKKYTYGTASDWCAFFASWVYSQAGVPLQGKAKDSSSAQGSSTGIMRIGQKGGSFTWHDAGKYTPQPGDIAVYSNDGTVSGIFHVNIIISATGPKDYNDIGGNEGENGFSGNIVKNDKDNNYWTSKVLGFVSPTGE